MTSKSSIISDNQRLALLDQPACEEFAALMADDFESLCTGFMADIAGAVEQIVLLSKTQPEAISAVAHKYKSAAGYLGALRLYDLLVQLEQHSLSGDSQVCALLAHQAEQVNQQTLTALQDFIAQQRSA